MAQNKNSDPIPEGNAAINATVWVGINSVFIIYLSCQSVKLHHNDIKHIIHLWHVKDAYDG